MKRQAAVPHKICAPVKVVHEEHRHQPRKNNTGRGKKQADGLSRYLNSCKTGQRKKLFDTYHIRRLFSVSPSIIQITVYKSRDTRFELFAL